LKLSFIVVTYQRGPLLQQCLDSIYQQQDLPRPFEVIVVDNGGDAVVEPPRDPNIILRVEQPGRNLYPPGGRNLGMSLGSGAYLVTLDDDAVWHTPDAVARMCRLLEENPTCGVVAVRSLDAANQPILSEQPHPNKAYILSVEKPVEVPYFYGVGNAIRAETFQRVGGYTERIKMQMEEADLSVRIIEAGYRILFDPNVAVNHYRSNLGRPIVGVDFWKASAINKSRMAWQWLPMPYPLTTLLIWSLNAVIKTRRPGVLGHIARALWAERRWLRENRRPVRPETVAYLKSIGARLWY
jgi:GT2 family glycosyltransferase